MGAEGTEVDRAVLPQWSPAWLPWLAVAAVLVLWPVIGYAASQAWQKSRNRIEDWLPASFPETQQLTEFFERFGSDEFLMISWPGCTLDNPQVDRLASALVRDSGAGVAYFAQAFSGRQVLDGVHENLRGLDEARVRQRLQGLFLGPDGQQTCVVALVSPAGLDDRAAAVQWARDTARKTLSLPEERLHIAGSTVDSVAIDEASARNLLVLNLLSALVCFGILMFAVRGVWLVGTLFLGALFNEQLALAVIHWTGGRVDSVLLLVANLAFVLTISSGLHYLGYFRKAVREGHRSPAWSAVKSAGVPTALAAATTSIGFLSLCASEIVPIRRFGLYAALLVPVNALLITGLMSIHVTWASRRTWCWGTVETLPPARRWVQSSQHALSRVVEARPRAGVLLWLCTVCVIGAGVSQLRTSVGTHKLLPAESKLIRDYAWLEEHIGPLVPIEIVLRIPADDPSTAFQRVQALAALRRQLHGVAGIGSSWSAINLLPPLPEGAGVRNTVARAMIQRATENSRQRFIDMRVLYEDEHEQCWRLSGRVAGTGQPDYEQLMKAVDQAVAKFKQTVPGETFEVLVSGGVPFVYRTQRQLLLDLLNSFSTAFVMIAATLTLLFRSLGAGLLSMLPNVTPALIVFGSMGWLGWEVELGAVLTASVIMGVCVDDTLHLLTHFRMLRAAGEAPRRAVQEALLNSGAAMTQTACVCGLGMLVFALSPFTPIARFAWLTCVLLMVGLAADLVLMPMILHTPLHQVFYRRREIAQARQEHAPPDTAEVVA
jgi:uncharacterized protein